MGKALPIVFAVVLFVYALFDLIATPRHLIKYLPKPLWFIVILLPVLGPLIWIFAGQKRRGPGPGPNHPSRQPTYRGPDDDPDYLRGL